MVQGKLEHSEGARIVRIKDTLHLDRFRATESLLGEISRQEALATEGTMVETRFNEEGQLDF
jgi:hypothetical protein